MLKYFILLFLLSEGTFVFSQDSDSLIVEKWTNYNRPPGNGIESTHHLLNKNYITDEGDTLTRVLTYGLDFKQVDIEQSFIHGKQNGLEIQYFPNGVIQYVNYYLNGRLWDVISRADSNGRFLYPGDLHNGSGTKYFEDHYGIEKNCFMTYKNGLPEGQFYWQYDLDVFLKGELTYKISVVKYVPAKRVTYTDWRGRIHTDVFDLDTYRGAILNNTDTTLKIKSVLDDSLPESPRDYKYISTNFDDPAIIPRGVWQLVSSKTGKVKMTVTYDDNGNAVKVVKFGEKGEVLSEQTFPPHDSRIW